jgi:hypothetical protein
MVCPRAVGEFGSAGCVLASGLPGLAWLPCVSCLGTAVRLMIRGACVACMMGEVDART